MYAIQELYIAYSHLCSAMLIYASRLAFSYQGKNNSSVSVSLNDVTLFLQGFSSIQDTITQIQHEKSRQNEDDDQEERISTFLSGGDKGDKKVERESAYHSDDERERETDRDRDRDTKELDIATTTWNNPENPENGNISDSDVRDYVSPIYSEDDDSDNPDDPNNPENIFKDWDLDIDLTTLTTDDNPNSPGDNPDDSLADNIHQIEAIELKLQRIPTLWSPLLFLHSWAASSLSDPSLPPIPDPPSLITQLSHLNLEQESPILTKLILKLIYETLCLKPEYLKYIYNSFISNYCVSLWFHPTSVLSLTSFSDPSQMFNIQKLAGKLLLLICDILVCPQVCGIGESIGYSNEYQIGLYGPELGRNILRSHRGFDRDRVLNDHGAISDILEIGDIQDYSGLYRFKHELVCMYVCTYT